MKKKITSLIVFILAISMITTIYAAITANVNLTLSRSTVKPGETFSVKLSVKDIGAGTDGLRGVQLKINYDKNILETLSADNIRGYAGLTPNYNESNKGNVLLAIGMGTTGITNDSDFVEVTFKVKENAELKDVTVTFESIELFNTEKLNVGNKSVTVKVTNDENNSEGDATPTPTAKPNGGDATPAPTAKPNGGSESTPTPSTKPGGTNSTPAPTATAKPNSGVDQGNRPVTNIDTNTSTGTGTSNNKGGTTSGAISATVSGGKTNTTPKASTTTLSSLPKAGIGSTITILTIIAALLGTIAYIKLRNYKEI